MQPIDGKALAAKIRAELKEEVTSNNLHPKLAVLLVGDDAASQMYVNLKKKAGAEIGVEVAITHMTAETSDEELKALIQTWNEDNSIHAILVQVPLPAGHDTGAIIQAIDPKKDADGFHPTTLTALYNGTGQIIPPLHEGILRLIATTGITMNTARATIIANSDIFSKPLEYLLRKAGAFVNLQSPDDLNRKELLTSNIIVIAIGRAHFLNRQHIAPNTVVIDVGTNETEKKKVVGDVDAENIAELAGYLTPVPGGVGPMTIAMLLKNVVRLATR